MKILVLMPLQEQYSYLGTEIWKNLTGYAKDRTFVMPQFMEYLRTTKISQNYEYAVFDSIVSAESIYRATEDEKENVIIIGNMPKVYHFDMIFNFQDEKLDLPYKDVFLDKLKDICQSEELLMNKLDMYSAEDSKFTLHHCQATADFLSKYLETDPKTEEIEKHFQEEIEKLKEKYGQDIKSKPFEA